MNIKNFEGDEDDNELQDLTEDIRMIVELGVHDVRTALPNISAKMLIRYGLSNELKLSKEIGILKASVEI